MEEAGWGFIRKVILPVTFYSVLGFMFCAQSFSHIPGWCFGTNFWFLNQTRKNTAVVVCHLVFLTRSRLSEEGCPSSHRMDVPHPALDTAAVCLVSWAKLWQGVRPWSLGALWVLLAPGLGKERKKGNGGGESAKTVLSDYRLIPPFKYHL